MARNNQARLLQQTLIDEDHPSIQLQGDVSESNITKELFDEFFQDCPAPRNVGLAAGYTSKGNLSHLILAISTRILIIQFHAKGKGAKAYERREILSTEVLCNPSVTLVAFDLDKIAIALFVDQNMRILNGVDLQDACRAADRSPLTTIQFAVGDCAPVHQANVNSVFATTFYDASARRATNLALQAWGARRVTEYEIMEERVRDAKRINTRDFDEARLRAIIHSERGLHRLQLTEAHTVAHEFSAVGAHGRTAHVRADRFQTRFQRGSNPQQLRVHDHATGLDMVLDGQINSLAGRNVTITSNVNLEGRTITAISTLGPARATNAEQQRAQAVLQSLQGGTAVSDNPFYQYIFNPSPEFVWPEGFPVSDSIPEIITQRPLNESQQRAVEHMLQTDNNSRLTIIQGPPGTGKTTVIAAFVASAVAAGQTGLWLVAQSNIAVKNIAEKLADVGFVDWRLLVSREFQYGWHDHLYTNINKNVICSDQFKRARSKIQGIPVILCTLSMLSHPQLHIFTQANPIKTLVVDEASQICYVDYVAPLRQFPSIHKICMIGDDMQLPPYGSEEDSNIKSIFEVDHLHESILFLAIQYRMPPFIGEVVSDVVYNGQLQSNPQHPVPHAQPSCWFVHVNNSREQPHETSQHNPGERAAVLKLAEKLQLEGKEYCVITPYDAQRNFLEREMKEAGLVWEDKCFNVDSFQGKSQTQGNEKDYIIVSLTRTSGLGFLKDLRRTNVMLTRCKRGMYIVTKWEFVYGVAAGTLVGRMVSQWGEGVWINPDHLTIDT